MKLEATCPTCLGKVPIEPFEGLDHVYGGKCPHCRGSRFYDVVQENGKTTVAPIRELSKPLDSYKN